MVINRRPRLRLIHFLLFLVVFSPMRGSHAGKPGGVPALSSSKARAKVGQAASLSRPRNDEPCAASGWQPDVPFNPTTVVAPAIHATAQEKAWKRGDRVEVQWKGDWYQAEVIEVKGNQYKIHYDGYDSSWDEWVDNSRIRAAGIKQNNPNATQPATADSPLSQVLALLRQSYEKQA